MSDATLYAAIEKSTTLEDGTILVSGLVSDDTIDSDAQIADAGWLKTAVPDWFKWGNIREMHGAKAAGVATELEQIGEAGHRIIAHIVDPVSVDKVDKRVLKGFSIGIRGARVVKDNKAAGGRIIDGKIVEVSLVDRPANPACTLMLAKSATPGVQAKGDMIDVERMLIKTEELTESGEVEDASAEVVDETSEKSTSPDLVDEPTAEQIAEDAEYLVKAWLAEGLDQTIIGEELEKRNFSAAQRREAAGSGAAMSDGSFPIHNEEDLHNAVRLAGNAKNPEAARRHIMERARSMGMTAAVPEAWSDGHKADYAELVKSAALQAFENITKAAAGDDPSLTDNPPPAGGGSADLTKSIAGVLDTALAPFLERLEALEKAPTPGGPVRLRPAADAITANKADELLVEIAQLDALAKTMTEADVADVYRKQAAELRKQHSQLLKTV